jgi:glucose-1-phosphate cytidylyltransferase
VDGGRVKVFSEKPQADEGFISGGFFVFQRSFFDYLEDDDACVLERDPMERLVQEGQIMSYVHKGFWRCMDTYRDFVALNEMWKTKAPWKVWEK